MTNLVVDGGANRLGVGVVAIGRIVQRRGNGLLHLGDVVMGQFVQGVGGDARLHMGRQEIQHFRGQTPCQAHTCDTLFVFDGDGHGQIISGSAPRARALRACQ